MDINPYFASTFVILAILYIVLLLTKKTKALWSLLLCLGLGPFIFILLGAVYSYYNGSGFGDGRGISESMFVIVVYVAYYWYILIPAIALIILSVLKIVEPDKKDQKPKKTK